MYADMTTITIQSNKIVSNEVEDNEALIGPFYKKKTPTFCPTQYLQKKSQRTIDYPSKVVHTFSITVDTISYISW